MAYTGDILYIGNKDRISKCISRIPLINIHLSGSILFLLFFRRCLLLLWCFCVGRSRRCTWLWLVNDWVACEQNVISVLVHISNCDLWVNILWLFLNADQVIAQPFFNSGTLFQNLHLVVI